MPSCDRAGKTDCQEYFRFFCYDLFFDILVMLHTEEIVRNTTWFFSRLQKLGKCSSVVGLSVNCPAFVSDISFLEVGILICIDNS